jgi:hypothetical protein
VFTLEEDPQSLLCHPLPPPPDHAGTWLIDTWNLPSGEFFRPDLTSVVDPGAFLDLVWVGGVSRVGDPGLHFNKDTASLCKVLFYL